MRFFLKTLLPLFLCTVSCTPNAVRKAFAELDSTIAGRQTYVESFELQNDSLRSALDNAVSDSTRWALSERLYRAYHHFSVDSAGRYVTRMQQYATSPEEDFRTRLAEIQLLVWSHDEGRALNLYEALDTTGIKSMGLLEEYLSGGIEIYTNISRFPRFLREGRNYSDHLHRLRKEYTAVDTVSYYGRKVMAQHLRDEGHPEEALVLFRDCYEHADKSDWHELTSIQYNTAMLYGLLGDTEQKKIWLAESAVSDFKAPNRDFLSLYELALTLYNEGDLKRAGRYIKIHFDDVLAGDFQAKVIRSSQAQNIIVDASMQAERSRRTILTVSIIILSGLLVIILYMMRLARRQARSLAKANEELAEANASLEQANKALAESNAALAEANKIKENYVFKYMDLSIRYLDRVEENRHALRQVAKNEGTDALLKMLRFPSGFADYKKFYRIFDQTFLGIFPHFIEDVNALLREDARFDATACHKTLPTELRILAALKLGIDDSPKIASFLKCSLSTVYTYRAKMRNQATCPKEEFEQRVKSL